MGWHLRIKRIFSFKSGLVALVFTTLSAASLLAKSSPPYTFIELPPLSGDVSSAATAINHKGQIVGYSANAEGKKRAVFWTVGSKSPLKANVLPDLGGGFSEALDINDLGEAVGQSATSNGQAHACFWNRSGTVSDLQTSFTAPLSVALALNNRRDIVGYRVDSTLRPTLLVLRQGVLEDWSVAQNLTRASDINDLGIAVGNEQDGDLNSAFSMQTTEALELLTPALLPLAEVVAVSLSGEKVGSCSSEDAQIAVRWAGDNASPTLLGTLGGSYSKSMGLNTFGLIVGISNLANTSAPPSGISLNNKGMTAAQAAPVVNELDRAFLWQSGTMLNLNQEASLPKNCILQAATTLNDFGEIAGYCNLSGNLRGFLLVPSKSSALTLRAFPSKADSRYGTTEPVEFWLSTNVKPKDIRVKVDGREVSRYTSIPYPMTIGKLAAAAHAVEIIVVDPASKKSVTWKGTVTVQ